MSISKKLLQVGQGSSEGLDIDELFSAYVYDGNGSTQTIVNDIDLANEGGMVWTKWRKGSVSGQSHYIVDSERGLHKSLTLDQNIVGG